MIARIARRLPFFYGWIVIAVAFVTMAVAVNARTAFSLLFPPMLAEFGWERGVTAGAFSFGFLVAAVLGPVLGRTMDRHGPVWVMEAAALAIAAGLYLATLATAPWQLYLTLGVLVGGGSVAAGYTGQALYLPGWFRRRRALAISIAYSGAGIGSITMLPMAQALIDGAGWRSACIAMAVLVVVLLVPLNLLIRRRPEELGLVPDGARAAASARRSRVAVVNPDWAAIDWTLGRALRTAPFWWIALGNFGALYAWYAVQVHQTKYLVDIGFSPETAAWALGVISLAGIPGQIAMGAISDRIGREPIWIAGCAGFTLTYVLLIVLADHPVPPVLWLMVMAQGTLGYGLTSVLGPIVAEIYEGRHFGAIYGSVMVGAIMGGGAGPWATGLLHDRTGSYMPGFLLAGAASVMSAAAIWIAAPRKVRRVGR
jgi:MFS family permease